MLGNRLNYSSPDAAGTRAPTSSGSGRFFSAVAFAALAFSTCVLIEVLNVRAGGYLPATERGGWRASPFTSEQRWRQRQSFVRNDPALLTRPLTTVEGADMQLAVREATANNALRDAVGSAGLAQYVIAPVGLVLAVLSAADRRLPQARRTAAVACAVASAAACGLMLYRGYFSSLRW